MGFYRVYNKFHPCHMQIRCGKHNRLMQTLSRPVLNKFSIQTEGKQEIGPHNVKLYEIFGKQKKFPLFAKQTSGGQGIIDPHFGH